MDLNSFNLLKEDNDNYQVGHPSGKSLTIGKKGLSDKAHEVIKKLKRVQHFATGGGVSDADIDAALQAQPSSSSALPSVAPGAPQGGTEGLSNALGMQTEAQYQAAQNPASVVASPALPPAVPPSAGSEVNIAQPQVAQDPIVANKIGQGELLDKEIKQAQENVGNIGANAKAQAQASDDYAKAIAKMQTPEQITQLSNARDDAFQKKYQSQNINPDRYFQNESTGSKIGAAIALAFSGFGAGLTGGPNLALQQINKSVDEDIDAQKNEQGKTLNLMRLNQEGLKNDLAANLATQNQLYSIAQAKIQKSLAGIQGADANQRGEALINGLQQQKLQNNQRLGVLTQGAQGSNGQLSGRDPSVIVDALVTDPAEKEKVLEEIKTRQQLSTLKNAMDESSKHLSGQLLHGAFSPSDTASAKQSFAGALQKISEGRYNADAAQKIVDSFLPGKFDFPQTIKNKDDRRAEFFKAFASTPHATNIGLNLDNYPSTQLAPSAQQALVQRAQQRLAANPNDANAAMYLKKIGMR